jgi:hypothetical protein
VDLARAVGRDDHDRRLRRLDRAELGDRHLEVGQHLEQIGLERLVGAVELVDQQDRRALGMRLQRLEQAGGSGNARRRCRCELAAVMHALRLGQADLDHLARVVPLVDRRRDVEALVALQADQRPLRSAASTLAISVLPTPASPSQNKRPAELQAR